MFSGQPANPRVLLVDRLPLRNEYRVFVNPVKLGELKLENDDVIRIRSEKQELVTRIAAVNCVPYGFIQMGYALRVNLKVSLGETVQIKAAQCPDGDCVVFSPIADTIENITGTYADILFNSGI